MTLSGYGDLWMSIGFIAGYFWRKFQCVIHPVPVRAWKGWERKIETQWRLVKECEIRTGTDHESDAIALGLWAYKNYEKNRAPTLD
jgi:hypothetical protein